MFARFLRNLLSRMGEDSGSEGVAELIVLPEGNCEEDGECEEESESLFKEKRLYLIGC